MQKKILLKKNIDIAINDLNENKKGLDAHNTALANWVKVLELTDSFFTRILSLDEKGLVPLSQIAKEEYINSKLNNGVMLITKLQAYGGSYYTKKNLWSALGAMPYFNSGGAVISYLLVQGPDREVIQSGVVPLLGGYMKPTEISEALNSPPNPPAPPAPTPQKK